MTAVLLTFIDSAPLQAPLRDEDGIELPINLSPELEIWLRNLVDTMNTNLQNIQDNI